MSKAKDGLTPNWRLEVTRAAGVIDAPGLRVVSEAVRQARSTAISCCWRYSHCLLHAPVTHTYDTTLTLDALLVGIT